MKKILILIGAVLVVALVAAGSFWGGMTYQTNQANQARANFENLRGQAPTGQFPGNSTGFTGGPTRGNFGGGGTSGQVKSISGDVLTLSTAQDVATVNLTQDTQIEKTVTGALADLQPGTRVLVIGQSDENGVITANRIQIVSGDIPFPFETPPATQEP